MSDIDKQINLVLDNIRNLATTNMNKSVAMAASSLYGEIVDRTPLDSGLAQASWEISYGKGWRSPRGSFTSGLRLAVDVNSYVIGTDIEIRNILPYMQKLEYGGYGPGPKTTGGFSKQAPQGMVRISVKMFNQFLDKAVAGNKL